MNQITHPWQNLSQPLFPKVIAVAIFVLTTACSQSSKKDETVHIDSSQMPQATQSVSNDGFVETAQAGEPNTPISTLFERLGGMPTLTAFASKFVDALSQSPQMKANPKVAESFTKDQSRFKDQLAIQLCEISGGPCRYKGKSMKDAHAGFGLTNAQWGTMRVLFIQTLRDVGVQKSERIELATRVARMKGEFVP